MRSRGRSKNACTSRTLLAPASSAASRSTPALNTLIQNAVCAGTRSRARLKASSPASARRAAHARAMRAAGVVARACRRRRNAPPDRLQRLRKLLVHTLTTIPAGGPSLQSFRQLRLRHRRRRQRRLPARQPAEPQSRAQGPAARGRRQGRLVLDRHPGRLPLHHRQPAHRLVLQDRARRAPRRALDPLCARQRARRLLLDQRHDLHARPEGGLGPLGVARQPRLVVGRRAADLQSLEDYEHGAVDGYGAGGEVRVEEPRVRWDIIDAWREAAAECGIPPVKVFNRGDNFGCAYFQMNQKRGRRWSATNAFLRPVMHRPNLTVMTGAARPETELRRPRAAAWSSPGHEKFAVAGAARPSSPPAPSARRSSCSSPASARRAAGSTASPWFTTCPASARTCTTTCRSACSTR